MATYIRDEYHTWKCDTAEEFTEQLRGPSFAPRMPMDAHSVGRSGWIFRGQANSEWPLVPTAHRGGNPLSRFTSQTAGNGAGPTGEQGRRMRIGWQLNAERRAVDLFLDAADKLGLRTPIDYSLLRLHREAINAALLNDASADYSEFPDPVLIASIALAQHHGVPTRLLDWSESPWIAVYFAAFPASRRLHGGKASAAERIAVFALHSVDKDEEAVQVVRAPRYANDFLRAQQGAFTFVRRANAFYLKEGRWPAMSDTDATTKHRTAVRRYTLPVTEADSLLRHLYERDITRHHLLPTLGNAALAYAYFEDLFFPKTS